ncbi:hypothetical protein [Brachyspira sp.]|uniref:hypothetical protein n=1 Tax=Brachyspira sp. TaxID=1977261 RepID=UPI003D7E95BE
MPTAHRVKSGRRQAIQLKGILLFWIATLTLKVGRRPLAMTEKSKIAMTLLGRFD